MADSAAQSTLSLTQGNPLPIVSTVRVQAKPSVPLPRPAPREATTARPAQTPGPAWQVTAYAASEPADAQNWLPRLSAPSHAPAIVPGAQPPLPAEGFAKPAPASPPASPPAARPPRPAPAQAAPVFTSHLAPRGAEHIAMLVTEKAKAHGVPLELAHAVVRIESNYNPGLTGRGATLGLMQIKYATARGLGFTGTPRELMDPHVNLEWGMRYLAGARKLAKGDLCGTVMRYQGGHRTARLSRAGAEYCAKVQRFISAAVQKPGESRQLARARTR